MAFSTGASWVGVFCSDLQKDNCIRVVTVTYSHFCTLFKQSCSVQSNSSPNSSEVRCGWSRSLGALEPQGSHTACWIYNRVTQSLSKTLFSGGNRVGFVKLSAGGANVTGPLPAGGAYCHGRHGLSHFNLRTKVDVFFFPHQRAAILGKGKRPDLSMYLIPFTSLWVSNPTLRVPRTVEMDQARWAWS